VASECEPTVRSNAGLGITSDPGEGNQAGGAALKDPLAAADCLARLKLPYLTVWNCPAEKILVLPQMPRLYRTPTIDSLVDKGYEHFLRVAHGRRCLTKLEVSRPG
jgi:hypothetical protein